MSDLLQDLGALLISKGFAIADGVDSFRDYRPDKPDNILVIQEYPGFPSTTGDDAPGRQMQILVRNTSYAQGRIKIQGIYKALDQPEEPIIILANNRAAVISAKQPPYKIEVDAQNREVFAFNILVITNRD